MWVRNDEYGAGHMRGWLYVQGWWGWVLPGWLGRDWEYFTTWHVEDRNKAYNPNKMPGQYHWVAYEWEWAPYIEAWRHRMIEKHEISDGGDGGGEYDIFVIDSCKSICWVGFISGGDAIHTIFTIDDISISI